MRLKNEITCDVLVMGAGIAGIMAAISAAEAGRMSVLQAVHASAPVPAFIRGHGGWDLSGPRVKRTKKIWNP